MAGKLLWKRRVKSGKFDARRRPSRLTSSHKGTAATGSKNGGRGGEHGAGVDRGRGGGLETGRRRGGGSAAGAPNRERRQDGGASRSSSSGGGDKRKSSTRSGSSEF